MSKPIIEIFDVITEQKHTREMNDEEYAQYLIDKEADQIRAAEEAAKQAEVDAAKTAIEAKLAALGLDLETVKLIAKLG